MERDAGLTAPYLDVSAFAAHLIRLHEAPALCKSLGVAGSTKVRTRYNVETQAPKLLNIIERRICTLAPTGMASQACNLLA